MEKHHILPRHSGGTNEKQNLIYLTRKNHILAHYYRWIAYNSKPDRLAYLFMRGDITGEAKREASKLAQKTWTFEKRSACSKKAYQTMLKRKSGIAARGETWRQNVSKASKKNILQNRKSRFTNKTVSLQNCSFRFKHGSRVLFINQKDFSDFSETSKYLCVLLGIKVKKSEHLKFIRLVRGERKVFHGIKVDMVISSQAENGQSFLGRFRD